MGFAFYDRWERRIDDDGCDERTKKRHTNNGKGNKGGNAHFPTFLGDVFEDHAW
jgi:hypothetical protein